MLPEHKHILETILTDAVTGLAAAMASEAAAKAAQETANAPPPVPAADATTHAAAGFAVPAIVLERPKAAAHGDVACNVAMQIAKPLRSNPRQLAEKIVAAVLAHPQADGLIARAEVAGPGFINFRLADAARQAVVARVITQAGAFGQSQGHAGERVLLEFVSANPTGPLHVGHGRQAALGDALAQLLKTQGWDVWREFYYNDAGVQIQTLAVSVQARARGFKPGDADWPDAAYNGDYIADIAQDYLQRKTVAANDVESVTGAGDIEDLEAIRRFAVAYLRHEQDIDLQAFGVRFEHYYLESSLYAEGRVAATVNSLIDSGKTFEQDGALWLRTTDYGDDKDRVMRKTDGTFTYFVPDVAYHVAKWERGFTKVINIQGSDHHGTVARVRAGLQALSIGIPSGYPDYILHKMVTVMRDGQEVKISKRAGSYVTVRDLIEWSGGAAVESEAANDAANKPANAAVADTGDIGDAAEQSAPVPMSREEILRRGRDAVRFFLISRKADTEFVFDVDLALKQNDENPVYYVQYAHARICSILTTWGGDVAGLASTDLSPLTSDRAIALLARLAEYPDMLTRAAEELAPHALAFYLRDLAGDFHSFYNADRVLVDDEGVKRARLALLAATRQVLENGLATIGVSAPQKM